MGRKCAAFMCNKTTVHGVKLFRFPKNYSPNWILAVDRGPTWIPKPNSAICSDHFHQDAINKLDRRKPLKDGSEPFPGKATSISEEDHMLLVSKIRAENLRQEELEAKNTINELLSNENPELFKVLLILRKMELELQEFGKRLTELNPLINHQVFSEKIINDVKTAQNKLEKYIINGSLNTELDLDIKLQIPKLEPEADKYIPHEEYSEVNASDFLATDTYITTDHVNNDSLTDNDHLQEPITEDNNFDKSEITKSEIDASFPKLSYESEIDLNPIEIDNEEISNELTEEISNLDEHVIDIDVEKNGKSKLQLSCKLCESEEIFCSVKDLNEHVVTEHGQPPYQCNKCEKSCETYTIFSNHFRNVHNIIIIECEICNTKLRKGKMKQHMMKHNGEMPYSCDICKKSFALVGQLKVHMLVHTGERPHKCKLCSNSYKQTAHLRHHVRSIHQGIRPSQLKKNLSEQEIEKQKRVCVTCGKIFKNSLSLRAHEKLHTGVKSFTCDICNKSCSTSGALSAHKDSHKTTKDYSCEICGNNFKSKLTLYQHKKTHDMSLEKLLSCELCSIKFTQIANLKRHIRVTHNKIKLHSCDVCERAFGSSTEVRQHMRVHTGEKPYECEICNKAFTQSSSLYSHKKKNHVVVEKK